MDPITQGALGAALPQSTWSGRSRLRNRHAALAGFLGMLGGMAADLDILIRSNTDPLLFLTYHRQFTHSLIFIPVGGMLVALAVHWIFARRWRLNLPQTAVLCSLGYATHAVLDTATSYGTMLLWPFSDTRYAWNIVSVIDPLFTIPLVLCVAAAAVRNKPIWARIGLVWALVYLAAGWWQHQSARAAAENLAASRGHTPLRFEIKPGFGNLLVWRSVYETDDRFHVDAFRVGIAPKAFEGTSVSKLDVTRHFPWLPPDSQQARDIGRFDQFSKGFSAIDPKDPNRIFDVRYAFVPNEAKPLFSILLSANADPAQHVRYEALRGEARKHLGQLWTMIVD